MKFEIKYPNIKYLEEEEGLIKGRNPVPCGICGELTTFIDLCSEAPFCSEECMEKFYKDYWKAESRNDNSNSPW